MNEYDGYMKASLNEKLKPMVPADCFFIDEITTKPNHENLTDNRSWLAVAMKVDGVSLLKLATTTQFMQTPFKLIFKKVREHLKVIHEEWGFFGSINIRAIYYDRETLKVTLTDWGRTRLPCRNMPSDHLSGLFWPYDRMFKVTDEDNYCFMDELALLCCFYNYTKLQAEDMGNQVLNSSMCN